MPDKTGVPKIQKAVVIFHEMNADEQMREIARLREKAILDERSAVNFAVKKREEDIIAKLRAKGFTEEQIRDILG